MRLYKKGGSRRGLRRRNEGGFDFEKTFGNMGGGYGGGQGGGYGGPRNTGPREMHDAKCADCGKDCQVPFKPVEGRQVFCRECHQKRKGG